MEKAREIIVKADEEFSIEKASLTLLCCALIVNVSMSAQAKLVKEAQQSIDSQYEQKLKAAEVSVKMSVHIYIYAIYSLPPYRAQSNQTNKARLRILQRREELLQQLFEEARTEVLELQKDTGRYTQLLEGFIVQVCRC